MQSAQSRNPDRDDSEGTFSGALGCCGEGSAIYDKSNIVRRFWTRKSQPLPSSSHFSSYLQYSMMGPSHVLLIVLFAVLTKAVDPVGKPRFTSVKGHQEGSSSNPEAKGASKFTLDLNQLPPIDHDEDPSSSRSHLSPSFTSKQANLKEGPHASSPSIEEGASNIHIGGKAHEHGNSSTQSLPEAHEVVHRMMRGVYFPKTARKKMTWQERNWRHATKKEIVAAQVDPTQQYSYNHKSLEETLSMLGKSKPPILTPKQELDRARYQSIKQKAAASSSSSHQRMTRSRKVKNVLPSQLNSMKLEDSNSRSASGSSRDDRTSSHKRKFERIDNILKKAAPVLDPKEPILEMRQQQSRQLEDDKASKEKFTSSSMESETPRL